MTEFLERMGFSHDTYFYAAYYAPLTVLGISAILVFAGIYIICYLSCLSRLCHTCPPRITKFDGACKMIIFRVLKLIYGDQLEKCKENDTVTYTIFGHRVRTWIMVVLFVVVILVHICTFIAFWFEFLVYETNHCDTTMDCFVQNKSQNGIGVGDPLPVMENCSDYENDNFSVSCFKFVFDYAGAIGDAGGVLVLASVIMNVQAGLWFGALTLKTPTGRLLALCALHTLYLLESTFMMFLLYMVPKVPLFYEPILGTNHSSLKFYTYLWTFWSAITASGPLLSFNFNKHFCLNWIVNPRSVVSIYIN